CGGRNVFADSPVMAPQVNVESVLAADPEAIITASANPADRQWQALWRRFPGMRAVRADNLSRSPRTRCTATGRARSAPRRSSAATSTRRGSRLPAGREEQAASRSLEAGGQLVVLVERVLQPPGEEEVLVVLILREQVEHRVARIRIRQSLAGDHIDVRALTRREKLRA